MTLCRSSLLALSASVALLGGATLAAADGPPSTGKIAKGGEWPDIPWSSWAGLYGGVHAGSADAGWDDGVIGGVQLGRNWQTGKVVYGVEGDVSISDADGVDWLASVRGRLGYLLSPGILAYGTAGLGLVNFEHDGTETDFVYGLGVEGKLTEATTVRLEYLGYSDTEIDVVRAAVNWKLNW